MPSTAPHPIRRAAIANLGCKVNQAEMDAVERLLRARRVELVGAHEPADLVVVNTCTVTSIADQKSRQAVRRARRTSPDAQLFVTGCSVAVDAESLAAADPAALLFGNESKDKLLTELAALLDIPEGAELPSLSGVEAAVARGRSVGLEVDEGSVGDAFEREIDRTRVFVKIQDGCSFHCTYCIIPRARGPERSVPANTVLAEVRRAQTAGHREVVLTGINAGTYAADGRADTGSGATRSTAGTGAAAGTGAEAGLGLPGLVRRILAETEMGRIRLSSIEPQHVTDDLLEVWVGSAGRCLPHFHIPLQSGDDTILRRMGRRYDAAFYRDLVVRLGRAIPGVAVHADLIVGFPGEDDAAWARTVAFLRGLDLAGIHVFRYSARPGTAAARMVGQVDGRTKKQRSAEALALAAEARTRFAARQLGGELRVLFERQLPNGLWLGHAENHLLVEAAATGGGSLENVIGLVRAESIDPGAPDRIVGRLLATDPPRSQAAGADTRHESLAESAPK
ncbi:MAG TPA: MiaB/RimO family radical SAM methylthiotransferase [Candidatus Limnocylindrales bacterium]|nr:MiaB/RimO family radical SAM methylthiotransferase [Candidatus Limnocylindrales bacterium]